MGPGLALATLGARPRRPVALIFCFDTLLLFSLVPFLMALADPRHDGLARAPSWWSSSIVLHPLHDRDRARRRVGGDALRAAGRARPADAVPAERRGALRAVRARRHGGAAADAASALGGAVHRRGQAPPASGHRRWCCSSLLGPFDDTWVYTAVLMAALPPALNVFVIARQYETWVEQASGAVLFGTLRLGGDADHRRCGW